MWACQGRYRLWEPWETVRGRFKRGSQRRKGKEAVDGGGGHRGDVGWGRTLQRKTEQNAITNGNSLWANKNNYIDIHRFFKKWKTERSKA